MNGTGIGENNAEGHIGERDEDDILYLSTIASSIHVKKVAIKEDRQAQMAVMTKKQLKGKMNTSPCP